MNKTLIPVLYYVKLGQSRLTAAQKIGQGMGICTSMTDNLFFPDPVNPTIAELQAATDVLKNKSALLMANNGRQERAAVQIAEAAYDLLIMQMGLYVQRIAHSQPELSRQIILSAGMPTRKTAEKAQKPGGIDIITVKPGTLRGQVKVRCSKTPFARIYEYQIKQASDTAFTTFSTSPKRSATAEGLIWGVKYAIRVRPTGTAGKGGWSHPIYVDGY